MTHETRTGLPARGTGDTTDEAVREPASRLLTRRAWIEFVVAGAALTIVSSRASGQGSAGRSLPNVTVYKDPNCGCCNKWVEHMRKAGFPVTGRNSSDVASIKRTHGVPERLYSCHTAVADGYVFEGHVPADLVERVLRERPPYAGLAVPGMPPSAPGMDIGHTKYEVLSFTKDGTSAVFAVRS
jgi:hypothetical protein